jgi:hypothetical protein
MTLISQAARQQFSSRAGAALASAPPAQARPSARSGGRRGERVHRHLRRQVRQVGDGVCGRIRGTPADGGAGGTGPPSRPAAARLGRQDPWGPDGGVAGGIHGNPSRRGIRGYPRGGADGAPVAQAHPRDTRDQVWHDAGGGLRRMSPCKPRGWRRLTSSSPFR